jgi:hypothetical protein
MKCTGGDLWDSSVSCAAHFSSNDFPVIVFNSSHTRTYAPLGPRNKLISQGSVRLATVCHHLHLDLEGLWSQLGMVTDGDTRPD